MSSHCAALSTATDSMIFGGRISPKNSATPLRRKNTVVHPRGTPECRLSVQKPMRVDASRSRNVNLACDDYLIVVRVSLMSVFQSASGSFSAISALRASAFLNVSVRPASSLR